MRDILFKAKTENGRWIEGDLIHYESGEMAIVEEPFSKYGREATEIAGRTKVIPETICQYTGLTDKNGNKIWENDIVNCPLEECCGKVIWNENEALFAFAVLCEDGMFEEEYLYDFENYIEVIGNIFDNKELLGE